MSELNNVIAGRTVTIGDLLSITFVNVPEKITKLDQIPNNHLRVVENASGKVFNLGMNFKVLSGELVKRDYRTISVAINTAILELLQCIFDGKMSSPQIEGAFVRTQCDFIFGQNGYAVDKKSIMLDNRNPSIVEFRAHLGNNVSIFSVNPQVPPFMVGNPRHGAYTHHYYRHEQRVHGSVKVLGNKTQFGLDASLTGVGVHQIDTDMIAQELHQLGSDTFGNPGVFANVDWYVPGSDEILGAFPFLKLPELVDEQA